MCVKHNRWQNDWLMRNVGNREFCVGYKIGRYDLWWIRHRQGRIQPNVPVVGTEHPCFVLAGPAAACTQGAFVGIAWLPAIFRRSEIVGVGPMSAYVRMSKFSRWRRKCAQIGVQIAVHRYVVPNCWYKPASDIRVLPKHSELERDAARLGAKLLPGDPVTKPYAIDCCQLAGATP